MSQSAGLSAFKIAFELSPIIFTGGLFEDFPTYGFPIMALTEAVNFPFGALSGSDFSDLDRFFAHFQVLPGSTLIQQDVGTYPFANAAVAGNAVITKPLQVSMLMICPMQNKVGWAQKLATITGLKYAFEQHNARGGTYTVLTPSYTYINCVMRGMHDASSQLTKQIQNTYQIDFEKPLLTESDLTSVLNGVARTINNFVGPVPSISGVPTTLTPSLPAIVPSASGSASP